MLKEIVEKCALIGIHEKRRIEDDYCELVFYSKHTDEWQNIFKNILGAAVKPAGQKPSKEDIRLTESYGGVYGDQVLFKKEIPDYTLIAMFWPWQDNVHTTLKMALLKK